MNRTKAIQIVVLAAAVGLFVAVFAAPKNYSEKKLADRARIETKKDTDNQLVEIKKELKADAGAKLADLESRLGLAQTKEEKASLLDSITLFWDKQFYPGAAVVFMEEKASLLNTAQHWITVGDRYLSMAEFGEPENKDFRLQKAEDCFQNALDKDPGNLVAKTGLGTVMVRKQLEPMAGIALLREVVDADPKNIRALLQLADFSILSGQYDKAIIRFDEVLAADPSYVDTYFFKAETYAKMGDKEKALAFLEEYKKNAGNPEAGIEAENYLKSNYGL